MKKTKYSTCFEIKKKPVVFNIRLSQEFLFRVNFPSVSGEAGFLPFSSRHNKSDILLMTVR